MKWGADKSLSQAGMNKRGVREKQQSKQQSKAAIKGNKGKKQGKASRKSNQKKQASTLSISILEGFQKTFACSD